jgi:hypothetical protein
MENSIKMQHKNQLSILFVSCFFLFMGNMKANNEIIQNTIVSIKGDKFLINGEFTYFS